MCSDNLWCRGSRELDTLETGLSHDTPMVVHAKQTCLPPQGAFRIWTRFLTLLLGRGIQLSDGNRVWDFDFHRVFLCNGALTRTLMYFSGSWGGNVSFLSPPSFWKNTDRTFNWGDEVLSGFVRSGTWSDRHMLCFSERESPSVRRKACAGHDMCGRDETGQRQHARALKQRGTGVETVRVEVFVSGFSD